MRILAFVVAAALLWGSTARSQSSRVVQNSVACTYNACALRLQGRRVIRGTAGHPVLSLGMWGASPLTPFASTSDSAASYATEFDRHYTPGARWSTLGALGIAVLGTALAVRGELPDLSDGVGMAYLGGLAISLGLFTYGDRRVEGRAVRCRARYGGPIAISHDERWKSGTAVELQN